jgi:hypothetical protein
MAYQCCKTVVVEERCGCPFGEHFSVMAIKLHQNVLKVMEKIALLLFI